MQTGGSVNKEMNKSGKEHHTGVLPSTPLIELDFYNASMLGEHYDTQHNLHTNLGSLTVLERMTGYGYRDTETGYRDTDGKFWLASGSRDVRTSGSKTIQDAIDWVKERANTCIGV